MNVSLTDKFEELTNQLLEQGRYRSAGNANYAWILHMVSKLSENGVAGFVLANGSMSTNTKGEGEIDLVDYMIALPGQLFYSPPRSPSASVSSPKTKRPTTNATIAIAKAKPSSSMPARSAP